MEDRAETLRRRIALYRRYLEEGVSADLASQYLRQIMAAKLELEGITGEKRHQPPPSA